MTDVNNYKTFNAGQVMTASDLQCVKFVYVASACTQVLIVAALDDKVQYICMAAHQVGFTITSGYLASFSPETFVLTFFSKFSDHAHTKAPYMTEAIAKMQHVMPAMTHRSGY